MNRILIVIGIVCILVITGMLTVLGTRRFKNTQGKNDFSTTSRSTTSAVGSESQRVPQVTSPSLVAPVPVEIISEAQAGKTLSVTTSPTGILSLRNAGGATLTVQAPGTDIHEKQLRAGMIVPFMPQRDMSIGFTSTAGTVTVSVTIQ